MSNLVDQLTLGEIKILAVDSDPSTGGGYAAEVGSYATINNQGTPVGAMYLKTGAGNTAWDRFGTTALSGVVSTGTAGRLSLYPATGNTVADTYVQNAQNVIVAITAQPTRTTPITYTVPNPGDAISAVSFVLTEGAQTVNGAKTFGNDVIVQGNFTVNGTTTFINSTVTQIEDPLITLNKGGGANTGNNSGFEIEENAVITAYFKTENTSPTCAAWLFKAPDSFELRMDLSPLTANRSVQMQDRAGYVALQTPAALTAGSVPYIDTNKLLAEDNANFFWDVTNHRLGIGNASPQESLHVTGNIRASGAGANLRLLAESDWKQYQATVNTTDATVTTLATVPVASNTVMYLTVVVIGRRTGGSSGSPQDSGIYRRTVRLKNASGTLTLFNLQSDYTSEDTAGFNATITVSGTNALVRVTGAANTNITWMATLEQMVNS